jgi:phosphoribosylpyrophosphate synthetase
VELLIAACPPESMRRVTLLLPEFPFHQSEHSKNGECLGIAQAFEYA